LDCSLGKEQFGLKRGFRYHGHTSDITIECWAPSLKQAFEEAALATLEVMVDTSHVKPLELAEVSVQGMDLQELLLAWIGRLIALVDINEQFYSKFEVREISETTDGFSLDGRAWGETIDLERHKPRTGVKAMTYADMIIEQSTAKTALWFTLDL
jgi:SHS2 domain-containing protein